MISIHSEDLNILKHILRNIF